MASLYSETLSGFVNRIIFGLTRLYDEFKLNCLTAFLVDQLTVRPCVPNGALAVNLIIPDSV